MQFLMKEDKERSLNVNFIKEIIQLLTVNLRIVRLIALKRQMRNSDYDEANIEMV